MIFIRIFVKILYSPQNPVQTELSITLVVINELQTKRVVITTRWMMGVVRGLWIHYKWWRCQSGRQTGLSTRIPVQASCDRWTCTGKTPAKANESVVRIPQEKNAPGWLVLQVVVPFWPIWYAKGRRPSWPIVHLLSLPIARWCVWKKARWESEPWVLPMKSESFFSSVLNKIKTNIQNKTNDAQNRVKK